MEFYAGRANLSRCMRASGYAVASLDLLYEVGGKHWTNPMDMLSASGFAHHACT